jgi:hypothetical protein
MRFFYLLLLALLLALHTTPAQAADDDRLDHPFVTMLDQIPATGAFSPIITYGDYRAAEQARVRQLSPSTYAEYAALDSFDTSFWLWTYSRIAYLKFDTSLHFSRTAPLMGTTVGYDWFDIDRIMTYGLYPDNGILLGGEFDPDAIAQAHTTLNYAPSQINGIPAWCSPNGCEDGGRVNLSNAFNGTLFGSRYGRYQTFLTPPGYLASASEYSILEETAATIAGEQPSLLDAPAYRALVAALFDPTRYNGPFVQAQIYPAESIYADIDLTQFDDAESYLEALRTRAVSIYFRPRQQWQMFPYGFLPAYDLLAFADRQEGDDQVALIAAVYRDRADAETARDELHQRVITYANEDLTNQVRPFLDQFDSKIIPPRLFQADDGYTVLIIEVQYPRVQEDEVFFRPVNTQAMQPAILYQFWLRGMEFNSFYPAWNIQLPEWYFETEW